MIKNHLYYYLRMSGKVNAINSIYFDKQHIYKKILCSVKHFESININCSKLIMQITNDYSRICGLNS